ncbi:MAG: PorV/PorQ family protein, partial [Bacteroidota bacterium]
ITTLDSPKGTDEEFSVYDLAGSISYSKLITNKFALGLNLKFIKQSIYTEQGNAFAADLGILHFITNRFSLGASVSNIGSKLKFDNDEYKLPQESRIGTAYTMLSDRSLLVAADISINGDNQTNGHIGVEYCVHKLLTLRTGYKSTDVSDLDGIAGLSAGIGIAFDYLSLDYVWVPYGDLGNTHRIGIGFKFGDTPIVEEPKLIVEPIIINPKLIKNEQNIEKIKTYHNKALSYFKKGDYSNAIAYWERIQAIYPNDKVKGFIKKADSLLKKKSSKQEKNGSISKRKYKLKVK